MKFSQIGTQAKSLSKNIEIIARSQACE